MFIPLAVFDALRRDEALLKPSQLCVRSLYTPCGLDELVDREFAEFDQPFDPLSEGELAIWWLRYVVQELAELLLGFVFLGVKLEAGFLHVVDRLVET